MSEWEQQHREKIRKNYSSLDPHEWDITFERLNPDAHMQRVRAWAPHMQRGGVLYGPPGTGKSTLGKALINRWATESYRALFITMGDALDNIRNAIDSVHTTPAIEVANLQRVDLLFIDDFGAEKGSEFADEKFFSVLDYRVRNRKHTWFSTNLSGDEIKKRYPARIFDRMVVACSWVACEGKSYRELGFKNEI